MAPKLGPRGATLLKAAQDVARAARRESARMILRARKWAKREIRNAVIEGAAPERYSLAELRAALEAWIAAIERIRRPR